LILFLLAWKLLSKATASNSKQQQAVIMATTRACLSQLLRPTIHPLHRQPRTTTTTRPASSKRGPVGPPKSKDRGPKSTEDTQTDFNAMDVLANTPTPTTAIDACAHDGFALNSGLKITGSGVLLVGGDAFNWKPWGLAKEGAGTVRNKKGQWHVGEQSWGLLDLIWPKPGMFFFSFTFPFLARSLHFTFFFSSPFLLCSFPFCSFPFLLLLFSAPSLFCSFSFLLLPFSSLSLLIGLGKQKIFSS
jgi:hypothetical protein